MNSHGEALAYCSAVPFALMTGDNDDAIVDVRHALVPALRAHEIRPADIAATCGGGLSAPHRNRLAECPAMNHLSLGPQPPRPVAWGRALSRGAGHRPATRAPSTSRSALSERCIFSETRYACLYGCTMNVSPAQRIILIERTRRGRARKASGGTRQTRWEAGRGVRLTR